MKNQTLRIISGKWKSRKINFSGSTEQLRPTSDRTKENLFNWIQYEIQNSRCLDLFSGSGNLGIESLSRGANSCTFIEKDKRAYQKIKKNLDILEANNVSVYNIDAFNYIKKNKMTYDFIFLDPPFGKNIISKILNQLQLNKIISVRTKVYIEVEKNFNIEPIKKNWKIIKYKTTSEVQYALLSIIEANS